MGKGGGGGGSPPPPAQQTVTQTNIPEYARPYVERMLGRSEALSDINQNPYQAYGGQRIAGFSPLQQQAFANVASQTPAAQLGTATDIAQTAGVGALGVQPRAAMLGQEALGYGATGAQYGGLGAQQALAQAQQAARQAGMYGRMGAGYGARGVEAAEQGFGAGARYEQMATSPAAMAAYMSPYMQEAVNRQKFEATRDYEKQLQAQKAQAVGAGAFGGSRQAIAQSEAQRNLNQQLQNIQAAGTQRAFEQAQQAQQFGAGLGLQGLQAGYGGLGVGMQGAGLGLQGVGQQLGAGQLGLAGTGQGIAGAQAGLQGVQGALGAGQYGLAGLGQATQAAGTLGQLGQTQFGQEQAISAEQQKVGAVQQAQAQQALDLAYQDFLKQRNYPYQQLAYMSDMLRGLPLSQSAQTMYTAPPNLASQLGGLGMAGLGIYGMSGGFRGRKGGLPKDFERYATGGNIKMMSTDQLQQLLDNPNLTPMEVAEIEKQLMLRRRMEMNPQSDEIMQMAGITSIPTGNMVPEEMAGGGIVAFAKGDTVKDKSAAYEDMLMEEIKRRQESLSKGDPFAESRAREAKIKEGLEDIRKYSPFQALATAGLGTMAGTPRYALENLGLGGLQGLKSYAQSKSEQDRLNQLLLQQAGEREKAQFSREAALLGSQQTTLGQLLGRRSAAETAAAARAETALRNRQLDYTRAQNAYNELFKSTLSNLRTSAKPDGNITLYKKYKDNPDLLEEDAKAIALRQLSPDLRELLKFPEPKAEAPPPPPVGQGGMPKVTTQEQYDKLKPGTKYIDPDGNVRQKK